MKTLIAFLVMFVGGGYIGWYLANLLSIYFFQIQAEMDSIFIPLLLISALFALYVAPPKFMLDEHE